MCDSLTLGDVDHRRHSSNTQEDIVLIDALVLTESWAILGR